MDEKKLSKKEMTEEELDKVSGGFWMAHDTAKWLDLRTKWDKAIIRVTQALNNAKASGDPVAIKEAQEKYDAVLYEKNLTKMDNLFFEFSHYCTEETEMQLREALSELFATLDYQYYWDWLSSFR